jgi:thymidylate synthase (FAD)
LNTFVELIDHLGTDLTVVNAARVSLDKVSTELSERDIKLLNYLARESHWSPFGHPQIQFRIKMPIFVARQWFKSSIGLIRNEVSRRYVNTDPEYFLPTEWRLKAENVKQGSSKTIHPQSDVITNMVKEFYKASDEMYNTLLDMEICSEQARIVLPLAIFTEFIETGSLYAYWRIYSLRNSKTHAQFEITEYAEGIRQQIIKLFPYSWKALEEA